MPGIVKAKSFTNTNSLAPWSIAVSTVIPFPDEKTEAHIGSSESLFVTILLNHFSGSQLTFVLPDSTIRTLGL